MAGSNELFVGLMSGTSLDAIDTVLVQFHEHEGSRKVELLAAREQPFPRDVQQALRTLIESPNNVALDTIGTLDRKLGLLYAAAVNGILDVSGIDRSRVAAIGNHGQTIRHSPDSSPSFTWQLGDTATIAAECGIPAIGQFRNADIALGGQGAPLVPAFHSWAFGAADATSFVVNIGGIANVTVLQPSNSPVGYDTGPGNTLLDSWYREHQSGEFDLGGNWAASGTVITALLERMLADPYFSRPAPKSTGREYFNMNWLHTALAGLTIDAANVQATLAELSARTIAAAIRSHMPAGHVWLCGGGAKNSDLMQRISRELPGHKIATTAALGIAPEWVESTAFAWLARARLHGQAAGLPGVTGARKPAILGSIHLPPAKT